MDFCFARTLELNIKKETFNPLSGEGLDPVRNVYIRSPCLRD